MKKIILILMVMSFALFAACKQVDANEVITEARTEVQSMFPNNLISESSLDLPNNIRVGNERVNVEWVSSHSAINASTGRVFREQVARNVTLSAILTYKDKTSTVNFELTVKSDAGYISYQPRMPEGNETFTISVSLAYVLNGALNIRFWIYNNQENVLISGIHDLNIAVKDSISGKTLVTFNRSYGHWQVEGPLNLCYQFARNEEYSLAYQKSGVFRGCTADYNDQILEFDKSIVLEDANLIVEVTNLTFWKYDLD